MIFSLVFLFLFIFLISGILYFFFYSFIPALKIRYEGINELLSSEEFSNDDETLVKHLANPNVRAFVDDSEDKSKLEKRLNYLGEKNCLLFASEYGSAYRNSKCCIGYGDCLKKCPQQAIIIKKNVAVVTDVCNGCGLCLDACPINLISMIPISDERPVEKRKGFDFWFECYKIFCRNR
ncbi:4Fe-4S dicluster-binding protein [Treponema zioleckii]|uniref:4Fe-4S dicluster-binding protein n=1 Tax=Treponema zioleckii TaxID=331680 RepID=UPI00168ABFE1|nr:4Fe-4S dicluster-binding protein [Treponema zioleckii]